MLVLTRKSGESIFVGGALEVKVLAVHGSRVKLGFSGPPEIGIQRSELCQSGQESRERHGQPYPLEAVSSGCASPSASSIPVAATLVLREPAFG